MVIQSVVPFLLYLADRNHSIWNCSISHPRDPLQVSHHPAIPSKTSYFICLDSSLKLACLMLDQFHFYRKGQIVKMDGPSGQVCGGTAWMSDIGPFVTVWYYVPRLLLPIPQAKCPSSLNHESVASLKGGLPCTSGYQFDFYSLMSSFYVRRTNHDLPGSRMPNYGPL